jgi:tRNA A-37 threonylcarbamoyl transferase component Bud32
VSGTQRLIAGRYRLHHVLADGGFGRVWHAHDERLDTDVVVKEVRLPPAAHPEEHARRLKYAEREARNAAKLRHHPNIVPVYDVVIEDDRPWIVMELVEGGSLENRIGHGPLPPEEAAKVAEALLAALDAAHQADIVHRDVKPANIMLTADGRILLTDFGIASHQDDTRLTADGEIIGTLEYLAPERLGGAAVAPAGDLFALGVTLFRAVEGVSPFLRDTQAATLAALAMDEPPPLERAGALAPLILGLLAKDPAARLTVADAQVLLRHRHLTVPPQPHQPPHGQRPPAGDGSFDAAWTGREPLDSYAERVPTASWQSFAGWAVVMGAAAIPLIVDAVKLYPGRYGNQSDVHLSAVLGYVGGMCAFLALVLSLAAGQRKKSTQPSEARTGWTLHVGPNYIMTTSAAGRREYTWDRIRRVTIKDFQGGGPHRYTALFLQFSSGSVPSVSVPAGWPHPKVTGAINLRMDRPVCVLGPMTHEQRTQLSEALARHG